MPFGVRIGRPFWGGSALIAFLLIPPAYPFEPGQIRVADVFLEGVEREYGPRPTNKPSAKDPSSHLFQQGKGADGGPRGEEPTGWRLHGKDGRAWMKAKLPQAKKVKPNGLALARWKAEGKARMRQGRPLSQGEGAGESGLGKEGLPSAVDNSQLACFPAIGNQNPLQSCTAFCTTYYAMTHMVGLTRGWDVKGGDRGKVFSPKWTYNMINGGNDQGSYVNDAFTLLYRHGAAAWSDVPYDLDFRAWCLDPSVWRAAIGYRMEFPEFIYEVSRSRNARDLKQLLANGYVLVFGTYSGSWQLARIGDDPGTADDDSFTGEWICSFVQGEAGAHGMTVVGYDDSIWVDLNGNGKVDLGEKGAYKAANSKGPEFGNAGFLWFAYDALRPVSGVPGWSPPGKVEGWILDEAYLFSPRVSDEPKMLAEFTIQHGKRGAMNVSLATEAHLGRFEETHGALQYQGGPWAFDGASSPCEGTFVFPFSNFQPIRGVSTRFSLRLASDEGVGTIKSFKVIDLVHGNLETAATDLPLSTSAAGGTIYSYVNYTFPQTPANTPPSISQLPDQTIAWDAASTGPLAFTIEDAQTPAAQLTVSVLATPALRDRILLSGEGARRAVEVFPENGCGADIAIQVSDGEKVSEMRFGVARDPAAPPLPAIGIWRKIGQTNYTPPYFVSSGAKEEIYGVCAGSMTKLRFTIHNKGEAILRLLGDPPVFVGAQDHGQAAILSNPAAEIPPSSSTEMEVGITPSAEDAWSFTLGLWSKDPIESPIVWTVFGKTAPPGRGLAESPWPKAAGHLTNDGQGLFPSPAAGSLYWIYPAGSPMTSSPVIAPDGTVYAGSEDGRLHAIHPDGALKWTFQADGSIHGAPALSQDGMIYFCSTGKKIYALRHDGSQRWEVWHEGVSGNSSPTLGAYGEIYVEESGRAGCVILDPEGKFILGGVYIPGVEKGFGLPAIGPEGIFCYTEIHDYILEPSGQVIRNCRTNFRGLGHLYSFSVSGHPTTIGRPTYPVLGPDMTIYIGDSLGKVRAIEPEKGPRWEYQTGEGALSAPALGADGTVFAASSDGRLYAIGNDGQKKWDFLAGGPCDAAPAIASDGVVFLGSRDGKLYALYPDGTKKWEYATKGEIRSTPAIGKGGAIYLGSRDGNLYALACPHLEVRRDDLLVSNQGNDALGDLFTGQTRELTYQLGNTGGAPLHLTDTPPVSIGGTFNCSASVSLAPQHKLAPFGACPMGISVTPSSAGPWWVILSVRSDDPLAPDYRWTLSGNAGLPEMEVWRGGQRIFHGGLDPLAGSLPGYPFPLTYRIWNKGTMALTLTGRPAVEAGDAFNCSVMVEPPPIRSIPPGGFCGFSITVTPQGFGEWSLTLSVAHQDPASSPYRWVVSNAGPGAIQPIQRPHLRLQTNWAEGEKDKAALRGYLFLPFHFQPSGHKVMLDIGGAVWNFTLDEMGESQVGPSRIKLQLLPVFRPNPARIARFMFSTKEADLKAHWADEGMVKSSLPRKLSFRVILQMEGLSFGLDVPLKCHTLRGAKCTARDAETMP